MNIVDNYISENCKQESARTMSEHLGVPEEFVKEKLAALEDVRFLHLMSVPGNKVDEIEALMFLINERVTGWAVDVAKERIEKLKSLILI